MKILILNIAIFLGQCMVLAQGVTLLPIPYNGSQIPLTFTINTALGVEESFTLPLKSTGNYNFVVDWGDGLFSAITSYDDVDIYHLYAVHDVYTIQIFGECTAWYFNDAGDKDKLISITTFGNVGLSDISYGFKGCSNATGAIPPFPETLTTIGFDAFRLSGFTSVDFTGISVIQNAAFFFCTNMQGDLILPSSISSLGNDIFQNTTFNGDLIFNASTSYMSGSMFRSMQQLANIYINATNLSNIQAFCFYQSIISGDIYMNVAIAPAVDVNGFFISGSPTLHVPVGAVGYAVTPYTFYTIVYDL